MLATSLSLTLVALSYCAVSRLCAGSMNTLLDPLEDLPPGIAQYEDYHTIDWQREITRDRRRHRFIVSRWRGGQCFEKLKSAHDAWSGWICVLLVGCVAGKLRLIFLFLVQGGHKPGKPGILRDFSERGKLREFSGNSVQPRGKIVTNKVFLVRHSNIWSECGGDLLYCWS